MPIKKQHKKIALERIKTLFKEAELIYKEDKKLANRYVELARKIGMKTQTPIPSHLKRRFCKHCYTYFIPGKNLRVRMRTKQVTYYCLECKKFMRFPHSRK